MAEQLGSNSTEIIPASDSGIAAVVQGDAGRYHIKVREYDAAGNIESFNIMFPTDPKNAHVLLRAGVLKQTTWKGSSIPQIIHAVWYADQMGLDIMAGDVYMAQEGRLSTTAGAKIRHAMNSGRIVGYNVDITEGPVQAFDYSTKTGKNSINLPNYHCKVTVLVKDWTRPMEYETDLAEWFEGRNPNWRQRTKYMLRRNALSKALEEVAPMGVEADEAPPVASPMYEMQAKEVGIPTAAVGQAYSRPRP